MKRNCVGDEVYLTSRYGNKIRTQILDEWVWSFGREDGGEKVGEFFDERAILIFLEEVRYRRENGLPTVIMNDGTERSGKTTFSILCNRIFKSPSFQDKAKFKEIISKSDWKLDEFLDNSPLRLTDVCFERMDLQKQMRETGFDDISWIIEDEAGHQLFAQEWWDRVQMTLVKNLQVTAKKRQVIMLNLPHFLDLTGKIRGRAAKIYCHCDLVEHEDSPNVQRGYVEVRRADNKRWEQKIWWNPYYAFRFRKLDDKGWEDYNKMKDAFIQAVDEEKDDKNQDRKSEALKKASKMIKDELGYSARKQAEFFNIPWGTYQGLTQEEQV